MNSQSKAIEWENPEGNFQSFKEEVNLVSNPQYIPPKPVIRCSKCPKTYKCPSGLRKHIKNKHPPPNDNKTTEISVSEKYNSVKPQNDVEIVDISDEDQALMKIREELKILVLNNNINLDDNFSNPDFDRIDRMGLEELKTRIIFAKHSLSKNMNKKISDNVLGVANLIVGSALGCLEELQYEVERDVVLRDATNSVISSEILCYISPHIKMSGLYCINLATAYKKASLKVKIIDEDDEEKINIDEDKTI